MTYACTDCSSCGKCYDKHSTCAACGGAINLLDDSCPACGEPITEAMRDEARRAYKDKRRADRDWVFQLAAAAREKRQATQKKVVYPWEQQE